MELPTHSFEATEEQLSNNLDYYVSNFVASLQSRFLLVPKGRDFIEFTRFERAYEALRAGTDNFTQFSAETMLAAIDMDPLAFVVLRTILGLSAPELAMLSVLPDNRQVGQATARRLDKRAREGKSLAGGTRDMTRRQLHALVQTAVRLVKEGAPRVGEAHVHRLNKADTARGLEGLRQLAKGGVPYSVLLYERLLGRPFATHRDAVSRQVGAVLENALKAALRRHSIPYHETAVAERIEGFDQAPDFLVPDVVTPAVVIEAKLAEDDGTARDKVTRVQHLAELREERLRGGALSFEVVACVDGRGFGIRREDVKKLLVATKGKLFTLRTVDAIVSHTALNRLRSTSP